LSRLNPNESDSKINLKMSQNAEMAFFAEQAQSGKIKKNPNLGR